MILADTSRWIDHFCDADAQLISFLNERRIVMHPFVIGELALGNLSPRLPLLADLQALPAIDVASDDEVFLFVEQHRLFGKGIGYVDAHLLASVRLSPGTRLWTRNKRLAAAAEYLGFGL